MQESYKEIILYMRSLRQAFLMGDQNFRAGGLYEGLMDMTYFSIATDVLFQKGLKLALVFVHGKGSLELWVSGRNREVMKKYRSYFSVDPGFFLSAFHEEDNEDALLEFILAKEKDLPEKEDAYEAVAPMVKKILEQIEMQLKNLD
nr:hypothetical protein [Proteiniclasticum ruminis]